MGQNRQEGNKGRGKAELAQGERSSAARIVGRKSKSVTASRGKGEKTLKKESPLCNGPHEWINEERRTFRYLSVNVKGQR